MQHLGRLILTLVLLTAFADLVPAFQDFLEPHAAVAHAHSEQSQNDQDVLQASVAAPDHELEHHHDGPCVGGHCHLGHCAFVTFANPAMRFPKLVTRYDQVDPQLPTSPILDSMKRPPRA